MFFQDIIFKLQTYWNDQGCVIIQPLDTEVGAGTSHPATMLKSLDDKAWNVAYVQPCRRPADGRYGQNPNRMQHYYQFQVLMKPSPDDIQSKCIDSLKLLGIDKELHDIRFVHSDWENPTLGAWGLGWEVWCNGMEIIQFTYMQQVGGIPCKIIPGEITYGLERLALYIQDKDSVWDLVWNSSGITYREIFLEQEQEFCQYNFHGADTQILISHFEDYEKIANQLIDQGLLYPAYSYCIKSSHLFNILEARGVLSVTERASYIGRVRNLTKSCCLKFSNTMSQPEEQEI
jgi:glycyl-tRNA synthetase alpha chain